MSERVVITGGTVVTMDSDRGEYADGYLVVEDGRVSSVGSGPAPHVEGARVVDARGCVVTPGLVNTHHHLYQWVTRGLAVDATLFEWLTTLYPVWGCIDEESVSAGSRRPGARRRWTTTTSSPRMAATCSPPRSRAPAPSGCGSCRPAARWTSAGRRGAFRRTTWSRRSTRSWRRPPTPWTGSTTPPRTRCCGSASLRARRSRST